MAHILASVPVETSTITLHLPEAYYMDDSDAPDVAAFEETLAEWKQAYHMAGAAVLCQDMA